MKQFDGSLVPIMTHWHHPWGRRRWVGITVVAVLIVCSTVFVVVTGGIRFVFSHSMYLPILLAGAMFGPLGGVLAGVAGGLALGPLMPIDTQTGEMQDLLNWVFRTGFFMLVGGTTGALVGVVAQLTGRDPVSGAPSQIPLRHDLSELIDRHKRGDLPGFSLLLLRLDNHHEVASTFGLEAGDELLRGLVDRLEQATEGTSPVYHLHGDLFGLVVRRADLGPLRERLRDHTQEPVVSNGIPVYLNLSLGRADCPDHSQLADVLVQHATAATELAGQTTQPEAVYDVALDQRNRQNLLLLSSLGDAMEDGQLRLHYQPQLDLADRRVRRVEALVRWQHPEHGLLAPGRFVPQAEKTDLIHGLTAWVLDQALTDLARLRAGGNDLTVAINLAPRNLHDPGLAEAIDRALLQHDVPPSRLQVEVTESAMLVDSARAARLLGKLRERGIGVAIDDFGVGRTSLGELKHLPASCLKIDRGFVRHACQEAADRHIIGAIVGMAHDLGLEVVAEGVEQQATLELVAELGCDVAQGFAIAHPGPADTIRLGTDAGTAQGDEAAAGDVGAG